MEQRYQVSTFVRVTVDESKFTKEFLREFRESFYPFHTVHDHMRSLASRYACGEIDELSEFIEGYGNPADFGIRFDNDGIDTETA